VNTYAPERRWVGRHARDYVLNEYYIALERRKADYQASIDRVSKLAYQYFHTIPDASEIAGIQAVLERGINEDWRACVQRYPEVLDYFYSLVEMTCPNNDDPRVIKFRPSSDDDRQVKGRVLSRPSGPPMAFQGKGRLYSRYENRET
jgi:hypothetical protein